MALLLSPAASTVTATPAASVVPVDPRCEGRADPLGVDVPRPHLSWRLAAADPAARGQRQSAYQVLVATSAEALRQRRGDLWDSGPMASDACRHVEYAGVALRAGQACWWAVRAADEGGTWSDWSAPARWSMGPMATVDWGGAAWIGSPAAVGRRAATRPTADAVQPPDPWLRKSFELPEVPTRAELHVASVGYHELYVNGQRVGDAVLAPSATDHAVRARYETYDIAPLLARGRNTVGLWLGTSWSIYPAYQTADKPAAPIALAQVDVEMPTAAAVRVVTDGSWQAHDSPNRLLGYWDANGFGGEEYDARLEVPDWAQPTGSDAGWAPVAVFHPALAVSADPVEPNRLVRQIDPVSVTEPTPGVYRIDMGVNYAGWFEMPVSGRPGDRVGFEFSERAGKPVTFGLHSAYVVGPTGAGTFRNRFNYMAGRWVQVTGLASKPDLATVKGWLVRTDYGRAGEFECDQPLLNRVYDVTNWTLENCTLGGYLVDCPHRERRGYGDGFEATRTAFDNYGLEPLYAKWAQDWRDVQSPDGNVPHSAPTVQGGGGPAWGGFCVSLPWDAYRRYGDRRLLAASWPEVQRWLAHLETQSNGDMLVRTGGAWGFLGDWQWPGFRNERVKVERSGKYLDDTREALFFNNCYWVYNLTTAAQVADALGERAAADAYRRRADAVRSAVHRAFFNAADHSYVNGYPAYLAIALLVDLPPADRRAAVWRRLEREILVNRKGHVWAGIIGGGMLFETLLDAHRDDLIYAMVSKPDYPGWGDILARGGTAFSEDWDDRGTHLHDSFLYAGAWFIEGLGGIRQSDQGYKRFTIDPWVDQTDGPRRVAAHYDSPFGRIATAWSKDEHGGLTLDVTVPPNTTATLRLDGVRPGSARDGNQPLDVAAGAPLVPGQYHVTAEMGR